MDGGFSEPWREVSLKEISKFMPASKKLEIFGVYGNFDVTYMPDRELINVKRNSARSFQTYINSYLYAIR